MNDCERKKIGKASFLDKNSGLNTSHDYRIKSCTFCKYYEVIRICNEWVWSIYLNGITLNRDCIRSCFRADLKYYY